jgi:hypothetical protein
VQADEKQKTSLVQKNPQIQGSAERQQSSHRLFFVGATRLPDTIKMFFKTTDIR